MLSERAFQVFDANRRPTSKTTASGVFTFGYDTADQLISEHNPTTGLTTWAYDAAYRRRTQTNSSGITTYAYDTADQLLTAQAGTALTTRSYDQNGSVTQKQDSSGTTGYTWDVANRLQVVVPPSGSRYTQTYRFDDLRFGVVAPAESGRVANR